jgi:hypothetical protein
MTVQPYSATAQVKSLAGTAAAPGITFTGNTSTGLFSPAANQVAITTGGVQRLLIGADGSITPSGSLLFPLGTAAAPSVSFTGDPNTGVYSPGPDQVAVATNGAQRLTVDTAATTSTLPVVHPLGAVGTPSITFTGDLNTGLYSPSADTLAAVTAGANRLHITSAGLVGIGTSSPSGLFDARGFSYLSGAQIRDSSHVAKGYVQGDARGFLLATDGATNIAFDVNGTERMRLDSSGRVGIGNTAPQQMLTVGTNSAGGSIRINSSSDGSNGMLRMYASDGLEKFQVYTTTTTASFFTPASIPLTFEVAGSERFRCDSLGRLLVGTSTAPGTFPAGYTPQITASKANDGGIASLMYVGSNLPSKLFLGKSNTTSIGSHVIVADGNNIGEVDWVGSDGSKFVSAARISAFVDGTPGTDDMPGRLVFSVTADGSASPTEAMRINNARAIGFNGANFGTAGQALVSNGSTASPTWQSITPTTVFGWNHTNDNYGLYLPGTSIRAGDLSGTVDINVQSRLRRCVINDAGVVQYYLDADDSTLKAGDWLRIVETESLTAAYTGTTTEATNSLLRTGVPAWAAGTFTLGQRVTHDGSLWECIAATTTATPAAGTVSSVLDGTDGQVVVEVPAFSVRYGFASGVHTREVRLGCNDSLIAQGFQPHPAFIKTDGTYKSAFYLGAYHAYSDGTNLASVSGQTNTRSLTRATFRTRAALRGTGWHIHSYLEHAAIQTLLVTEYRDHNSQKVVGNGSDAGTTYGVTTGQSNARGNRSANSTDNGAVADDYVSYRGIENLWGRAWQWVDGFNVYERVVYLTNNQTAFADDTSDGYRFYAQVPSGSSSYQKEIFPLPDVFLPSVVTGASDTTYLGDAFWTGTGWRVAIVGGVSSDGTQVGAFTLSLNNAASGTFTSLGARAAFASN